MGAIVRRVGATPRAAADAVGRVGVVTVQRAVVGVLALALVAPVPGDAQNAPVELTLERALEIARVRNPDLNRARNGMDGAAASERSAWGAYLPQLRTSFSLFSSSLRRMTGEDDFGQPVQLDDPSDYDITSASGGIDASFTLFDGFGRLNRLQASRAGSRAAAALTEAEVVRVEAEVKQRFYNAIAARLSIELEERILASAEDRLEAMRAMVDAGRATPQDVLGAEVDVASARMAVENAQAEAYQWELLLREVMGVGSDLAFELAGQLPELVDPAGLDGDSLVQAALEANPSLRQATAAAAEAENLADAQRAGRWPTVQFNAGVDRDIALPALDQLTDFPWNRGLSFGISASLPIFSGFQRSEQIAWASVDQANAEEDLREARLAVERNVLVALTNVRSAFRSAEIGQRAAELATLRLETAQEGFRLAAVPFTELQQLTEIAARQERAAVESHATYARALATLEQAVGGPVTIQ